MSFLAMKISHERQCAGEAIDASDAQERLTAKRRKLTFGPLIKVCSSRKIIRAEHPARFQAVKIERDWLVHRSMVENAADLYDDATRNSVVRCIAAVQQEASSLKGLVVSDCNSWAATHSVDWGAAQAQTEDAMRKLKGG
jgi:hypothetical protein